jgi:hypothetical protein
MCETTSRHVSPTTPISLIVRRNAVCWSAYKRVARKIRCTGLCGDLAAALLVLCAVPAIALAQQPNGADNAGSQPTHDGAPTQIAPPSSNQQAPDAQGAATVVGTVHDASGASVSGAEVRLIRGDGTPSQTTASGANGEFSFIRIVGGSYRVTVNDVSFAPFTSAEFTLTLQQMYEVPDVSLTLATKNTEVTVHPTEFVAAEQLRAAEKQRLLGVIPNFYTSYIYDAAPLTARQKFLFAVRGTFDPVAMVGVGFGAGIEQATNAFSGYGQGASGYAKRYASKFTDGRTSDFLTHAVFPSLLHQDPRYFYQGSGSFKSRLAHAVGSAFFTRNDGGFTQPNYSYLLGDFSSAALSNLYYPHANRGAGLVFTNAALGLAGRIGGNVLREFSKRVTTNVPAERKP